MSALYCCNTKLERLSRKYWIVSASDGWVEKNPSAANEEMDKKAFAHDAILVSEDISAGEYTWDINETNELISADDGFWLEIEAFKKSHILDLNAERT